MKKISDYKFKLYNHKKYLSRGTVCQLEDNTFVVIDDNDRENSEHFNELNYYCFNVDKNVPQFYDSYNVPQYRMINQQEIVNYSIQKVKE